MEYHHHRTASRDEGASGRRAPAPPVAWEALSLVGPHLDAKSLATASCASKSWLNCLSSGHLWQPLFSASFPSVVLPAADSDVPNYYHRLYSAFHRASKRRNQQPPKPALSLHSLLFMVSLSSNPMVMGPASKTVIKPCESLEVDPNGLFRFDLDISSEAADAGPPWTVEALSGLRVTWHVVVDGWKEVFCMMDCPTPKITITTTSVDSGWFSEELPSPGCCSRGAPSGLVGELRLGVRFISTGTAMVVDKVSVGVLSIFSWRYVTLDDALRYLQHFLHPS